MRLYHLKMHFTCIMSISLVFYREAELSNLLCYLQISVEVNDNGRDTSGQGKPLSSNPIKIACAFSRLPSLKETSWAHVLPMNILSSKTETIWGRFNNCQLVSEKCDLLKGLTWGLSSYEAHGIRIRQLREAAWPLNTVPHKHPHFVQIFSFPRSRCPKSLVTGSEEWLREGMKQRLGNVNNHLSFGFFIVKKR